MIRTKKLYSHTGNIKIGVFEVLDFYSKMISSRTIHKEIS